MREDHEDLRSITSVRGVQVDSGFGDLPKEITEPPKGYPDDNPKTAFGLLKLKFSVIPVTGIIHFMRAMMDGARKYGPLNWRTKKVTASIYYDAAERHMMAWYDGQEDAEDSGVHHLGHAMACLAIILDAHETGNLIDDRPPKGQFAALLKKYEKPMEPA